MKREMVMSSFQRTISLCCACFVLATTAMMLFLATTHSLAASLRAGIWISSIELILFLAVVMCVRLRVRMQRDLERLRSAIRRLADPRAETSGPAFAIEEIGGCASELADVAGALRKELARLGEDASRDALTGLLNRRPFVDTLTRETAFAKRTSWPLSLVMVDLDHFKALNDRYGHKAGDVALRRTAERLSSLVRQSDCVARYGGEEFAVVLPGARLEQATRIAQQLRDALRCDSFVFEGHTINVTASFGVAELHECRVTDSESLISCADRALYEAKHKGRDTVVAAEAAGAVAWTPAESPKADASTVETTGKDADDTQADSLDRDTLALMGSTFSVLRVIPDKHRVARDAIQQVAAVLQATNVRLFLVANNSVGLVAIGAVGSPDGETAVPSDGLKAWIEELRRASHFVPQCFVEPSQSADTSGSLATAVIRIPLVAYGEVIGAIEACGLPADFQLTKRRTTVLSGLSVIAATAIKNCETYERLTNRLCSLVEALCKAVHATDAYRRDHSERVSAITVDLARAMGQHDEEELQLLRVAGLVHDVGNIRLPDRLFKKKGPLREGEWKLIHEHCRIGADIIDGVADMNRLADIVRHHHEHFGGGGYPDGLAGSQIPIESRILAVADAFVAMTSPRPHRPALSAEEAVDQIRQGAGRQFDPAVVEVFLERSARLARVTGSSGSPVACSDAAPNPPLARNSG